MEVNFKVVLCARLILPTHVVLCCRFEELLSHVVFVFDVDVFFVFFCSSVFSLQLIIKLEATPN